MNSYELTNMIIDDDFDTEEYVTAEFKHGADQYSITFKKADLEIINSWIYRDGTSYPADLAEGLIEAIREDVKRRI